MKDLEILHHKRITQPEQMTHMWVAAFLRHIGIETKNKTLGEVQQAFNEVYAAYLNASPHDRPANEKQYDHSYNYHHNVDALKTCMDMLVELQKWMGEI